VTRRAWRGLAPYVVGFRRVAILLTLVACVTGLAEAGALLIAVRMALSLASGDGDPEPLALFGWEFSNETGVAAGVVLALVTIVGHYLIARTSSDLASAVLERSRATAVARFVSASWATQAMESEGALQEAVTTLSNRAAQIAQSSITAATQLVMLLMLLMTSVLVDPVSTVFVVGAGCAIVVGLRPLARATRRAAVKSVGANSDYAVDVRRVTGAAMELRVFGVQQKAEILLAQAGHLAAQAQARSRFYVAIGSNLFKDLAVLLLVVFVGSLILAEVDTLSGVGVVVALVVRALASAAQLNSTTHGIVEATPSLEALNNQIESLSAGAETLGTTPIADVQMIELRNVSYEYSPEFQALKGVNLKIDRGEAVGIIGPSGGGKSTLVQVLLRLRQPSEGQLLVNGHDYAGFDAADWARQIGFVPQEPSLLEGTIAENISYYRDIGRPDIEAAAREANVYDDITRLPLGFDTVLGPRGVGLSGGQKQRVAIARALAGRPRLLIMDEPSSALDVKSEMLLHGLIGQLKGDVMMVIVAHRLQTVEACDRLVVVESGRITQTGTGTELRRDEGFYRAVRELMES
jgi:ATP-binding cassette subfamily B protein